VLERISIQIADLDEQINRSACNARKLAGNPQALEERHVAIEFDEQVDIALRSLVTL